MSGRPAYIAELDMQRLMALWFDDELTKAQVAQGMGVSASWLSKHQHRLGLPERGRRTAKPMVDPTPAEIAERCAEIRQRNNLKHRRTGHPDPQPGRIVSRAAAADPTFFKAFCDGVL